MGRTLIWHPMGYQMIVIITDIAEKPSGWATGSAQRKVWQSELHQASEIVKSIGRMSVARNTNTPLLA